MRKNETQHPATPAPPAPSATTTSVTLRNSTRQKRTQTESMLIEASQAIESQEKTTREAINNQPALSVSF
jgi:hypothetical protein